MAVNPWTENEIANLRRSEFVPGRSLRACYVKAYQMGISFRPINPNCGKKDLTPEEVRAIADLVACGKYSITYIASLVGVSRDTVYACAKKFGIPFGPKSTDRPGDRISFEGRKFSWKRGSWIATSGKERPNLTHLLWEKHYGERVGKGFCILFADGDRHNLAPDNLIKLTFSEAQKRRFKDPAYRATALGAGVYSLLMTRIKEAVDPSLKAARIDKIKGARKRKRDPR